MHYQNVDNSERCLIRHKFVCPKNRPDDVFKATDSPNGHFTEDGTKFVQIFMGIKQTTP